MTIAPDKVRIFIRPGITDLRKASNGLTVIVQEEMKQYPFSGSVYMFCNRERKQQIQDLTHQIHDVKNESIENYNKYIYYKEQYTLLTYKRFMRSAEQLSGNNNQPVLFTDEAEPVEVIEREEEEKTEVKSHTRKKPGRKPIDPKIERRERIIELPLNERKCACGAELRHIGEEISEKLEIIPPQIYVDRIKRLKYACRCCEGTEDEDNPTVRIAPVEPAMIPGSISAPSLLATIFTYKFSDHLPYDRQQKIFYRIGVEISKLELKFAIWRTGSRKCMKNLFRYSIY